MITSHPTVSCIRDEHGYLWLYDDEHQGFYIGPYAGITADDDMMSIYYEEGASGLTTIRGFRSLGVE